MLAAGALFALMGLCVKLGSAHFGQTELVFYRSVLGLAVLAPLLLRPARLFTRHPWSHFWRGLSGGTALWLYFYAIAHLPLPTAVALNYTSPLFLAAFGMRRLGERTAPRLLLALAVGFAGVLLVLRPAFAAGDTVAALAGLASGFLASLAYVNVRRLGTRGEPEWRVVFYFSLMCSVAFGGLAWHDGLQPVRAGDLPLLLGLGLSATLAQLAMTRAYRKGRTLVAGCLSYSTLLFSTALSAWQLAETPSPGALAGMALIVAAGILSMSAPESSTPIVRPT